MNKKIIWFINAYFIITIIYFFYGRYEWYIPSKITLLVFLVIVYLSFNAGYFITRKIYNRKAILIQEQTSEYKKKENKYWIIIFRISCLIILLFQITWVFSVFGYFTIIPNISKVGINYFFRLSVLYEGKSIAMQIRTLLWGLTLFAYPIGFTNY